MTPLPPTYALDSEHAMAIRSHRRKESHNAP